MRLVFPTVWDWYSMLWNIGSMICEIAALRLFAEPLFKRYVVDAGLVGSSAGLTPRTVLAEGDLFGRIIDTFGLSQLRPEALLSIERSRMYHLRVEDGRREIDLVVERDAGRVLGIEFKAGAVVGNDDAKHLHWLRDELGDRFLAGAVLHTGPAMYPIGDRVFAIPLCAIWG